MKCRSFFFVERFSGNVNVSKSYPSEIQRTHMPGMLFIYKHFHVPTLTFALLRTRASRRPPSTAFITVYKYSA